MIDFAKTLELEYLIPLALELACILNSSSTRLKYFLFFLYFRYLCFSLIFKVRSLFLSFA